MRFSVDNRGVTVQVGAILLFATLIIGMSIYQVTIVPSQNADVEYKHSQAVQNQMTDVRNGILRSAATGNSQPASVTLGTQYSSRVFLVNPPPATGSLRTGSYENDSLVLSNIGATESETDQFFAAQNYTWSESTKFLEYAPDYNEYDNAPDIRYEASILSNYYPRTENGTAIPLTDQLLVNSETQTLTLVTLNGSLSTSQAGSVTVSPETLSAPYQRVQVAPADRDKNVTISLPTHVSASQLRRIGLGEQSDAITVSPHENPNQVTVDIAWDREFTLQTARIGVGSNTDNPPPRYLTLIENRNGQVTVEARDKFNNAVSGVSVTVATSGANPFVRNNRSTNEDGQAIFEVRDGGAGTATLEITEDGEDYEQVNVTVRSPSGNETPPGTGDLVKVPDSGDDFSYAGVEFDVENTGSSPVTIDAINVESTSASQVRSIYEPSGGSGRHSREVYINASTPGWLETGDDGTSYQIGDRASLTSSATLSSGSTATISMYAFRNTGGNYAGMNGRTLTVSLYLSDGTEKTFTINT